MSKDFINQPHTTYRTTWHMALAEEYNSSIASYVKEDIEFCIECYMDQDIHTIY